MVYRFHSSTLLFLLLTSSVSWAFLSPFSNRRSHAPRPLRSSTGITNEASLQSVTFPFLPKGDEPDLLCDFLMEIGACATYIVDADRGTEYEEPLFVEPQASAWKDSLQWAVPVWNRCNVTAHFPASIDLEFVYELVEDNFPFVIETTSALLGSVDSDKDWVSHVQKSWKPVAVAERFILKFPWHTEKDVAPLRRPDSVELLLQGGIAFGTGEHPTTQLCLEWLEHEITKMQDDSSVDTSPISLLDYGSGSGILGMAACALAPNSLKAIGVDIDLDAVLIANANAVTNKVNMKNYLPPLMDSTDSESKSLLLKAHNHAKAQLKEAPVDEDDDIILPEKYINRQFDLCVANILAGPLQVLAPTLTGWTKRRIGLSGILAHQADDVIAAYEAAGWSMQVEKELSGWVLLSGSPKE